MTIVSRARTRLMHAYFRLARPMTLGVRGIVVDGERRVLLVRQVSRWCRKHCDPFVRFQITRFRQLLHTP